MEIKTPTYWKEAEFQPLAETVTAYGHKVLIPQKFLDAWEVMQKGMQECRKLGQEPLDGLRDVIETRGKVAADFCKTMMEIYKED